MEREGGPAAAFPPPAPLLSPSRRRGNGLLTSLQALLESLASSACGENASTVPSSPLDAARGALCSAATTTREDASSLFVLALVSALIGALAYLSLLAMGRARRSSRLHAAARLGGAGAAAARSAAAASLALRQAFPSLYPPAPHALFELEETHLRSLPAQALCGVCFKPADVDIVSEASANGGIEAVGASKEGKSVGENSSTNDAATTVTARSSLFPFLPSLLRRRRHRCMGCERCGAVVHAACSRRLPLDCKPAALPLARAESEAEELEADEGGRGAARAPASSTYHPPPPPPPHHHWRPASSGILPPDDGAGLVGDGSEFGGGEFDANGGASSGGGGSGGTSGAPAAAAQHSCLYCRAPALSHGAALALAAAAAAASASASASAAASPSRRESPAATPPRSRPQHGGSRGGAGDEREGRRRQYQERERNRSRDRSGGPGGAGGLRAPAAAAAAAASPLLLELEPIFACAWCEARCHVGCFERCHPGCFPAPLAQHGKGQDNPTEKQTQRHQQQQQQQQPENPAVRPEEEGREEELEVGNAPPSSSSANRKPSRSKSRGRRAKKTAGGEECEAAAAAAAAATPSSSLASSFPRGGGGNRLSGFFSSFSAAILGDLVGSDVDGDDIGEEESSTLSRAAARRRRRRQQQQGERAREQRAWRGQRQASPLLPALPSPFLLPTATIPPSTSPSSLPPPSLVAALDACDLGPAGRCCLPPSALCPSVGGAAPAAPRLPPPSSSAAAAAAAWSGRARDLVAAAAARSAGVVSRRRSVEGGETGTGKEEGERLGEARSPSPEPALAPEPPPRGRSPSPSPYPHLAPPSMSMSPAPRQPDGFFLRSPEPQQQATLGGGRASSSRAASVASSLAAAAPSTAATAATAARRLVAPPSSSSVAPGWTGWPSIAKASKFPPPPVGGAFAGLQRRAVAERGGGQRPPLPPAPPPPQRHLLASARSAPSLARLAAAPAPPPASAAADRSGRNDPFPPGRTPVIVVINTKSGPQRGAALRRALSRRLNPCQIVEVPRASPAGALRLLGAVSGCRVLVVGGDGTVSWVLGELDRAAEEASRARREEVERRRGVVAAEAAAAAARAEAEAGAARAEPERGGDAGAGEASRAPGRSPSPPPAPPPPPRTPFPPLPPPWEPPPVAILPLGTGNDLARVLGWGGGISALLAPREGGGSSPSHQGPAPCSAASAVASGVVGLLADVADAALTLVDRWDVSVVAPPGREARSKAAAAAAAAKAASDGAAAAAAAARGGGAAGRRSSSSSVAAVSAAASRARQAAASLRRRGGKKQKNKGGGASSGGGGSSSVALDLQHSVAPPLPPIPAPAALPEKERPEPQQTAVRSLRATNYVGFGVDAKVALDFHAVRDAHPRWFRSQAGNKLWYTGLGATDIVGRAARGLPRAIEVLLDGGGGEGDGGGAAGTGGAARAPWRPSSPRLLRIPPGVEGIMFLNIGSYAGGVDLWNSSVPAPRPTGEERRKGRREERRRRRREERRRARAQGAERARGERAPNHPPSSSSSSDASSTFESSSSSSPSSSSGEDDGDDSRWLGGEQSFGDGLLEIVAVYGSFHLGQLQVGLSRALRLARCSRATIRVLSGTSGPGQPGVAMQVDGEPWFQAAPATVEISAAGSRGGAGGTGAPPMAKARMLRRLGRGSRVAALAGGVRDALASAERKGIITAAQRGALATEIAATMHRV